MKRLFELIAYVSFISGIVSIILFFMMINTLFAFGFLFSAVMGFAYSYAWGLIGEMWEKIERLERKLVT